MTEAEAWLKDFTLQACQSHFFPFVWANVLFVFSQYTTDQLAYQFQLRYNNQLDVRLVPQARSACPA